MHIIAIDCGASFVKCALFEDEKLIDSKRVAAPPVVNGTSIFSVEKINALATMVREILRDLSASLDEATVCIDNEMHGFILAEEDGAPYTDYISWQTELGSVDHVYAYLDAAIGREKRISFIRKSGMPLRSGLPGTTLLWMKENGSLNVGRRLYFYTLGDYLIRRIFDIAPLCHPTNAAATGLYDLEADAWNAAYIDALTGGSDIVFPAIGKDAVDCTVGNVRYHVLPAIGDQQAALIGSELLTTDVLSFNMGTGAQVSRLMEDLSFGDYQTRPYFYGKYLKTIPHIPSGRALNVYFRFVRDICRRVDDQISDERVWEIIHKAADGEAPGNALNCDLSFFENAVTDHTVGSIQNITEHGLTLNALIHGVFDQMAVNFAETARRVNEDMPDFTRVLFSGGIAQRWLALRKRIVDMVSADKVNVTLSTQDTLYGCMRYAQLSREDR